MPRSVAARTMPAAMGCSERLSSAAARRRISVSLRPSREITSVTPNRPSVSVPVLSKTTESRARASDAQSDRRFPVYRTTEHRISGTRLHGLRLPRQQCLVDGGPTLGDPAVRGNPLAGLNQHQIILPQVRDRNVLG